MIDRGGNGETIGKRLLSLSNRLFRHWHRVRDGTLPWSTFQRRMCGLRREVKQTLQEGSMCPCVKTVHKLVTVAHDLDLRRFSRQDVSSILTTADRCTDIASSL